MHTVLLPKGVCRQLERTTRNFIWGAKRERSCHSVAWDYFFQAKRYGWNGINRFAFGKQSYPLEGGVGTNKSSRGVVGPGGEGQVQLQVRENS